MNFWVVLSGLVDAIFVSNDNTALSAFKTIVKAANNASIPVFVSDTDVVKDGAIAAFGPNQYDLGLQTAKMIVLALAGEKVGSMEIEYPKDIELYLNQKAANQIGIKFPTDLVELASYISE